MDTEALQVERSDRSSAPETIYNTSQLSRWMYDTARPYVTGKVLEIASRTGNIAGLFVSDQVRLRVSDPVWEYCRLLKEKFEGNPIIKGIHQIDPANEVFDTAYLRYIGRFDTVLLLNTIDTIPGNQMAVINLKKLLKENGHLIVQVPAQTALFNELTEGLDYWRRRNWHSLRKLLGPDFEFLKIRFFTVSEIQGKVDPDGLKKDSVSESESKNLYHQLVPNFQVAQDNVSCRFGLSLVAVAKKIVTQPI